MLTKLLKYELKSIFKFLIIFYSIAILFATLTRLFFMIDNSVIMNIIAQICNGVTISMIFNILINNIMRLWVRFKNNFYGDEAYLTHTLPVKKNCLYQAKFLTAFITMFVSILVIGVTLFIAYYSKENIKILMDFLLPVAELYNSSVVGIIIAFLFIVFLELANTVQIGFTGIVLGHRMQNMKLGASVLFGFISYIVMQVVVLILMFIVALFIPDLMNLFYTTEMINLEMIKLIIYLAIGIYSMTLVIGYIVNIKLFNKGVNVE